MSFCSPFAFLFSPSLFLTLLATRHILLFTMFDSISLQPARNFTEIIKALYSLPRKKKCRVNYDGNKCSKIWVFRPSLFTFLFADYFVTISSLNNVPYRNLSQNCKQHFKIRKLRVLILFNKVFFIIMLIFYTAKIWQKLITLEEVFTESKINK